VPHRSAPAGGVRPLQFVKLLSWSFFIIIFGLSAGLAVFLSNSARNTLLDKQKDFGLLLAENINHQIYSRFTLPTLIGFGRINLSSQEQYDRLDQVVRSTIHSFHVRVLRVYDEAGRVVYSLDKDEVGSTALAGARVKRVLEHDEPLFDFFSRISTLRALFSFGMKPGTMQLHGYYLLRAERNLGGGEENPVMGLLEFNQDVTDDYVTVINFERLIFASSLTTSVVLFIAIVVILRRTDRLNAQRLKEKERLERELLQQEKLAGMGRMVAGVAHEIRNPLGIICSSAELVLKKARKEESSYVRILEALFAESKRLSRTVSDFLDYARPKKPRQDRVDLAQVLDQAVVFLETESAKRGVEVVRDYAHGLEVLGDKDLLYRALYNILSNALQAMDGGEGRLAIRAETDGDGIRLSVTDTGPGFDPEHMDNYLDPFFTTKEMGTGLGLAIVASILEGHGARMALANAEGGGARVDMAFKAA
jgi:signal transduction histidine kinase